MFVLHIYGIKSIHFILLFFGSFVYESLLGVDLGVFSPREMLSRVDGLLPVNRRVSLFLGLAQILMA